ncbi:MAG TPA: AMP-binding protein [Acetobacteraceae bacterium]|nr:AMP-binding protein [Acetobacteraceae bacterium]
MATRLNQRAAPELPLLTRAPEAALFRTPRGPITTAAFLGAVRQVAAVLPAAPYVLNLCRDRYRFTVALAAALLRRQVMLLAGDHSHDRLHQLAVEYPGLYSLTDDSAQTSPLPHYLVQDWVGPDTDQVPRFAADQLAAIVFTSGTTGHPSAHHKPWGALVARSIDAARRFHLNRATELGVVGMVPAHHMYGFETTVLLPLHASVTSWSGPAFFPSDVEAALAMHPAPRVLITTPLQIRALLHASVQLPPLARIISATAPLPPELAAEAEQRWNTQVWEIFGATEVGSIASRRTGSGDVWTTYPRVRLVGDDPVVHAPFAPPTPLADQVNLLDATRFRLVGRRADMIKLGGRRESLAALNRVLTGIDGVTDGVFLAPADLDTRPTARLTALVVAPERTQEQILAALRGKIDPLFLPRRVIRLDTLPRNEFGKLPDRAVAAIRDRFGVA